MQQKTLSRTYKDEPNPMLRKIKGSQNDIPNSHGRDAGIPLLRLPGLVPPQRFIVRHLRELVDIVLEEEQRQLPLQLLPLARLAVAVEELAQHGRPPGRADQAVLQHAADHHVAPHVALALGRFLAGRLLQRDVGQGFEGRLVEAVQVVLEVDDAQQVAVGDQAVREEALGRRGLQGCQAVQVFQRRLDFAARGPVELARAPEVGHLGLEAREVGQQSDHLQRQHARQSDVAEPLRQLR